MRAGKLQVFIAEYLPLQNKGEEAILRGIQDMLGGEDMVSMVCLDKIRHPQEISGVSLYPWHWLYDSWPVTIGSLRDFELGAWLVQSLRRFLNLVLPQWVYVPPRAIFRSRLSGKRRDIFRVIEESHLVIVGHDGVFSTQTGHIIRLACSMNRMVGILGCGFTRPRNSETQALYAQAFAGANFGYFREIQSFQWAASLAGDKAELKLAPDPAFAMLPASPQEIDRIIKEEHLEEAFAGPVVAVTAVENFIIRQCGFIDAKAPTDKALAHYELMASLVQHIIDSWKAAVVFLPHCTGPGERSDDRRVAREIASRVRNSSNKLHLVENEYSARQLKGLIGRCDLLIGERTHSLIGAISSGVPILCLGVREDRRTTDIIGDMCELQSHIYYLNQPVFASLKMHADSIWNEREFTQDKRRCLAQRLHNELQTVSSEILEALANRVTR